MVLAELRHYALLHHIPIISKNTEDFFHEYLAQHPISHILEIGSAIGYSSLLLDDILTRRRSSTSDTSVTSREISYPHYFQALLHTKSRSNRIKLYLGDFCQYPGEKYLHRDYYDMIFIDGRKSETLQYLIILAPYIQTTTHIIVDDAIKFKSKMTDCYQFLDKYNIKYAVQRLDEDDGVLIIPPSQFLPQALFSQSDL